MDYITKPVSRAALRKISDGIELHSIVAIGTIGCKGEKVRFLRGYNAMLERIEPSAIICFGTPFAEMDGNIIAVDYRSSRKAVR